MSLPTLIRFHAALTAIAFGGILSAIAPVAGAQVYKWVDEKGVVNYGNKPPASSRGAKGAAVVEDRVSVYTPDPAVTQATQNARNRSGLPNTGGSFTVQGQPERSTVPPIAAAPAPNASASRDPCAGGESGYTRDVSCYGYPSAYPGRYGTPRLVQPQLPQGAIAGNVNQGNSYTPGLSTQGPLATTPSTRPAPSASFTLKERDDRSAPVERGHRWR